MIFLDTAVQRVVLLVIALGVGESSAVSGVAKSWATGPPVFRRMMFLCCPECPDHQVSCSFYTVSHSYSYSENVSSNNETQSFPGNICILLTN